MDRKEWLARRKTLVGGSDIAKIAGLSPYGGPFDVWLDKTGQYEQPETWPMRRGKILEPVVIDLYEQETGRRTEPCDLVVMPDNSILGGTPDALVVGEDRGLEIKTGGGHSLHQWGKSGTDDVPEHYLVQCCWYMMLTERELWDLAALIGDNPLAVYTVKRNLDLEAALREMAEKFWRDHILTGTPPPVGGSESSRAWLRQQFPENRRPLLDPTPEALQLIADYQRFKPAYDAVESDIEAIKSRLMQLIGDAAGIAGVATWKKSKDTLVTDWKEAAHQMAELLGADGDRIISEHTAPAPGTRRFLFSKSTA